MPKRKKKADAAALPIWNDTRRSSAESPDLTDGQLLVGTTLYGTGFIQRRDPDDDNFPLSAVISAVADARSQEKVWQLPQHLLNQGSTNSCVGHACAHFILTAPIMDHSIDPITLWHRAQQIDEFPGNEGTNSGTSVRAGFKVLREQNLITTDYRWAASADEVLRFVLTRGPVVVGSKWYPGMSQPTNGVLRLTGNAGATGHAYLLFGFSPDQDAFSWRIPGAQSGGSMAAPFYLLTRLTDSCRREVSYVRPSKINPRLHRLPRCSWRMCLGKSTGAGAANACAGTWISHHPLRPKWSCNPKI